VRTCSPHDPVGLTGQRQFCIGTNSAARLARGGAGLRFATNPSVRDGGAGLLLPPSLGACRCRGPRDRFCPSSGARRTIALATYGIVRAGLRSRGARSLSPNAQAARPGGPFCAQTKGVSHDACRGPPPSGWQVAASCDAALSSRQTGHGAQQASGWRLHPVVRRMQFQRGLVHGIYIALASRELDR
jgi:hypothetical protein